MKDKKRKLGNCPCSVLTQGSLRNKLTQQTGRRGGTNFSWDDAKDAKLWASRNRKEPRRSDGNERWGEPGWLGGDERGGGRRTALELRAEGRALPSGRAGSAEAEAERRGGAVSARRQAECSGPRPGHVRTRERGPGPPEPGARRRPPRRGSPQGRGYGAGGPRRPGWPELGKGRGERAFGECSRGTANSLVVRLEVGDTLERAPIGGQAETSDEKFPGRPNLRAHVALKFFRISLETVMGMAGGTVGVG